MRKLCLILFCLISLNGNCQVHHWNDPQIFPNQVNKLFVDSLNNKPIDYYLNHPGIDTHAKLFYEGKFAVSDDTLTFAFLDSVLTNNPESREFYLYILNSVLKISDGALSEYIGLVCRKYLEKFPCEFISLKHNKLYSDNYQNWLDFIAHEYYFEHDPVDSVNRDIALIKKNLPKGCVEQSSELEYI